MNTALTLQQGSNGRYELPSNIPLNDQLDSVDSIVTEQNSETPTLFVVPGNVLGTVTEIAGEYTFTPHTEATLKAHLSRWVVSLSAPSQRNPLGSPMASVTTDVARAYLARGQWAGVPVIRRKAVAPVVGSDLVIHWEAGYAASARTWVTEAVQRPGWDGRKVTEQEAHSAAQYLAGWYRTFAFTDRRSVADALALAFTPVLLGVIPDAPIPGALYKATKEGSGKTMCAQMTAIIATGQPAQLSPLPTESKIRTEVTSILKGSVSVRCFDNIKSNLDSDVLESLLTSRRWSDRKFHSQDEMTLPNDTLWLFTKNTPALSPDMLRRVVVLSLDIDKAPTEWNDRVLVDAMESRTSIAHALATVVTWWSQEGRPSGSGVFVGFDQWAGVVSGVLESVGIEGFGAARAVAITEVHTDNDDTADVLARLSNVMEGEWTAADLTDLLTLSDYDLMDNPHRNDIRALKRVFGSTSISVGMSMSKYVDKQVATSPVYLCRMKGRKASYAIKFRDGINNKPGWADYAQL